MEGGREEEEDQVVGRAKEEVVLALGMFLLVRVQVRVKVEAAAVEVEIQREWEVVLRRRGKETLRVQLARRAILGLVPAQGE